MRILTLSALVLLVSLLTIAIGISVHRACSINLSSATIIGECFKPSFISKQDENKQRSYALLLAEIESLEDELVLKTCSKKETTTSMTEPEIKLWKEQDIKVLSSCWKLKGDEYKVVNINDPTIETIFNNWKMCFDSDGNGDQIFTGINAPICEGKLKAKFITDETLLISDLMKVSCDNGMRIIKREVTCVLNEEDIAECLISEPSRPDRKKNKEKVLLQRDLENKILEKK